jgi:4-hydroxy-2-oxoheptanedioate aldolase
VLATERALAWRYVDAGANFVAVGVDTSILVQGARQLASEYKTHAKPVAVPSADGVPSGGY